MTADELLDHLADRGATVSVIDGQLSVRAPRGAIDGPLRDRIAGARDALVAALIARDDPTAPFPLTDIQQAYLVGRTGAYPLGGVACHLYHEFEGPAPDPARLAEAWRAVIARHPALRTVRLGDGRQRLLAETPAWTLPVHDLRRADEQTRAAALAAIRARLSTRCAPAESWPPFAIELSLLPDGRGRVHVDFDLMALDAAGMLTTLTEWHALYTAPTAALPPPPDTFRAAVLREHRAREAPEYAKAEAWWSQRLDALPPPPDLPLACSPDRLDAPAFERHGVAVPAERWAALTERAARCGLTPTNALAAVFAEVLATWSGGRPFTVAMTLFRPPSEHPDAARIVGEFTTTALIEVDPRPETFVERARALRDRLADALEHIACSGVAAQRAHARRTGRLRHFPVVLTSVASREHAARAERLGWLGEVVYAISQTPQVWIDNQVVPHQGGVRMSWDVPRGLFPPGLIADAFAASARLLDLLAEDDGAWQRARFDLLPPAQQARRRAFDATEGERPRGRLFDAFRARADAAPHRVAVIGPDETLDYGALDARANQLGHALAEHGVEPGEPVVVCVPRGALQAVAVLGIHGAGGAYVPVDPDWPAARIEDITARCGARLIVLGAVDGITWPPGTVAVRVDRLDDRPRHRPPAPQGPDDRAYIIHTSGSTGAPKGVVMAHAATLNTIDDINRRFAVGPDDRVLAVSSLAFDLSVYDLFGPLSVGAAVVMLPPERARDVHHWMELLDAHRITLWSSVPALFELLVEAVERAERPPGALRAVLLSGDWIPTDLPDRGRACWPAARIDSLGGATEAAIWSIAHPTDALEPGAPSVPYGSPLTNQRFHVLDSRLEPSPEWVPGELYIGGAGLAEGYWRDPERTAARFIEHPGTGERLYRTGDTGRFVPAGHIEFLGRLDTQVKINGHRIELGEIEAALRAAPAVRDAVVDAPGDRHRRRLVAYVVPDAPGAPPSPEALTAHLAARLPASMVPALWITIPAVPLTANGKVDRAALPAPPDAGGAPETAGAAADGALGRVMSAIAEIMPGLAVGPDDDLVRAGANSVDLIRLGTRLNDVFGARPTMSEILRRGTGAALARFYAGAVAPPPDAPTQLPLLVDPAARTALKEKRLGLRPVEGPTEPLPRPPIDMAAYLDRQSQRRFLPDPIPREALGAWLSVLCPVPMHDRLRYRHGSAGATYPLRTYLSIAPGGVAGLAAGAWYHDPIEHRLAAVGGGEPCPPEVHVVVNRPWAPEAPLLLAFVAERRAIEPIYGARWRDFALIELGARVQLLESRALACGLGACQIGELDGEAIAGQLGLDETEAVLHGMVAGPVAIEDDTI